MGSVKGPLEPFMSGSGDNLRDALGVCSRSSTLIWVGVPMEAPIGNIIRDPMGDPIEGALDLGKFYLIGKT